MRTKLNLINVEESDIKYKLSRFPDGEVQIELGELNRKDFVIVYTRICNAEDLFILMQVGDILNRQGVQFNLVITYLMGMRNDRVIAFERPFTLSIIAKAINSIKPLSVVVLEPHSERTISEINNCHPFTVYTEEMFTSHLLVFPDQGAADRYSDWESPHLICRKKRDLATGKLLSFEVTNPTLLMKSNKPLMIIDDLCDGGGTFCGIASVLRELDPHREISLAVTHMVNSKGIENTSQYFKEVFFTDSYMDWSTSELPSNCTQIKCVQS